MSNSGMDRLIEIIRLKRLAAAPGSVVFVPKRKDVLRVSQALTQGQWQVITMHFNLDQKGVRSLRQIAKKLGIRRENVRRRAKKAIEKLVACIYDVW